MLHSPSHRTLLAGLVASVLMLPTSSAGASAPEATDPDSSEADAIRFRSTFGLQNGLEFVRAAAVDTARYSDEAYGVPLDEMEVAELQRRARIQLEIDPFVEVATDDPTFAGAYLDQMAGGAPVFMFTRDVEGHERELSSRIPADFGHRTRLAARTFAELEALNERIGDRWDSLRAEGVAIVGAGIRTDLNVVEIGVTGLTPETSERLRAEFGEGSTTIEARQPQADACVDISNCRPMKGGIEFYKVYHCTSGFIVETSNTSEIMMLTAGHCLHISGGVGAVFSHNADTLGIADVDTWNPGSTRNADVGLIDLYTHEVPATKNQILTSGSTVKSVGGWDATQLVGDQTCRSGLTSGKDCGEIVAVGEQNDSEVPGWGTMHVKNTNRVSFDSTGGDSGGPEYFESGSVVIAQGTHVHSDPDNQSGAKGWFTPISWGNSSLTNLFGYGFAVCVVAAC
jgi:hypothetical protein